MISPEQYKYITDQINELQLIDETSIKLTVSFQNEINDLSAIKKPVDRIKTNITAVINKLDTIFTSNNSVSSFVRALQLHVLDNTVYNDINEYLVAFDIQVKPLFADVSARVGYPIDDSNLTTSEDYKFIYMDRSYYSSTDVDYIKGVIDDGVAAGYNGIVSISSQWANIEEMVVDKDGQPPIERMQEIIDYCHSNDFKFILSFFGPTNYTDNYATDPNSDVLAEGCLASDMRFIVQADGTITPDPDDLTRIENPRFYWINQGFTAGVGDWEYNWWSRSNVSGWLPLTSTAGNYYDPYSRNYPLLITRDTTVIRPTSGESYSIKFDIPEESTWQALHVYAGTANTLLPPQSLLVINGGLFFTIVGGTSGAVEPDWTVNQYGDPIRVRNIGEALYEGDTLALDGNIEWTYFGPVTSPLLTQVIDTAFNGYASVPATYVHISFWVKFDGYVGGLSLSANAWQDDRDPTYPAIGLVSSKGISNVTSTTGTASAPLTADWQQVHLTFNTLNRAKIQVYLSPNMTAGTMWMSEFTVEPAGIMNVLRRDNTPFVMTSEDGLVTYVEGVDYTDAEDLNNRGGDFVGAVDYYIKKLNYGRSQWHDVPTINTVGGTLSEGDVVLCTYYHIGFFKGVWKVCPTDPQYFKRLEVIANFYVKNLDGVDGYYFSHDEIRLSGCDPSCQGYGTQGQHLAANIKFCYDLMTSIDTGKPLFVWNDMFDPYHNANWYPRYQNGTPHYLSWEGLDPSIIIANWNFRSTLVDKDNESNPSGIEKYKRSIDFFYSLGNKQILAGYYDHFFTDDPTSEIPWHQYAQDKRYRGAMYATWVSPRDYSNLQAYINMVNSSTRKIDT